MNGVARQHVPWKRAASHTHVQHAKYSCAASTLPRGLPRMGSPPVLARDAVGLAHAVNIYEYYVLYVTMKGDTKSI